MFGTIEQPANRATVESNTMNELRTFIAGAYGATQLVTSRAYPAGMARRSAVSRHRGLEGRE
jgi:hypothetical protein